MNATGSTCKGDFTNLHTRFEHHPQRPQPPAQGPRPQPERQQTQVALKLGREYKERPKGKWPIQNQAVNRPTSMPTFIRSTSSLLTFMASLYRSVLCASVTLSAQELSAGSVRYFKPTANAIPTPTPHIQTLDFDLYLKKAVFDPPTYRLCC